MWSYVRDFECGLLEATVKSVRTSVVIAFERDTTLLLLL
jgi:hypothetical protein